MPHVSELSAIDQQLLRRLQRAFSKYAGSDGGIDRIELQRALGLQSEYLVWRVLKNFDIDGDGVIRREEFLEGVRTLLFGSDRDKLYFAFRLHDDDGDGALDRQEVLRMISICLAESDVMQRTSQPPEQLVHVLFLVADQNRDGKISFDEFAKVMKQFPSLVAKMTRSEAIWIAPNEDIWARSAGHRLHTASRFRRFIENRWLPLLFLAGWILANLAIFAAVSAGAGLSPHVSLWVRLGRATGYCINFNGALILIPMMRRLLSWVRASSFGRAIPVDDAIEAHRIVGHALFAFAVAHSVIFVFAYISGHSLSAVGHLFTSTLRGSTGLALLAIFAIIWVFSLAFIRRTSRFELFYFTHLLYLAWIVIAIVHAPSFGFVIALPLLGFAVEQVLRLRRRAPVCRMLSCDALRSGVIRLELPIPAGFDAEAGDYAFLCAPAIAPHEWHPFTISSAPESDHLTFHVRSLGNWTAALRRHVELQPKAKDFRVYVDGPYGSPSARIFKSQYAVFIGAGIGVTPFASVLESLVLRANGTSARPSQLRKVHFFWLNRDQYSFEWFAALLSQLEKMDQGGLLDFHLCMTGGRSGATALGLELAREVMHKSGRSDLITGLRTKTHLGPPDWETMLGAIARQHQSSVVDVYFCGPPGLARKVRSHAEALNMPFYQERF